MEFAWVKAWYEAAQDSTMLSASRTRKPKLIDRVHLLLCLGNHPSTKYKRLLTGDGQKVIQDIPARLPFKNTYQGVNDAYQLDKDEPSALNTIEKSLCLQYAKEELDWDGSNPPYPRWMTQ
jgi:hypothetical protein